MNYSALIMKIQRVGNYPSTVLVSIPTSDDLDHYLLTFKISSFKVGGTRRGKEYLRLNRFLSSYVYTWKYLGYHEAEHRHYYNVVCNLDLPF